MLVLLLRVLFLVLLAPWSPYQSVFATNKNLHRMRDVIHSKMLSFGWNRKRAWMNVMNLIICVQVHLTLKIKKRALIYIQDDERIRKAKNAEKKLQFLTKLNRRDARSTASTNNGSEWRTKECKIKWISNECDIKCSRSLARLSLAFSLALPLNTFRWRQSQLVLVFQKLFHSHEMLCKDFRLNKSHHTHYAPGKDDTRHDTPYTHTTWHKTHSCVRILKFDNIDPIRNSSRERDAKNIMQINCDTRDAHHSFLIFVRFLTSIWNCEIFLCDNDVWNRTCTTRSDCPFIFWLLSFRRIIRVLFEHGAPDAIHLYILNFTNRKFGVFINFRCAKHHQNVPYLATDLISHEYLFYTNALTCFIFVCFLVFIPLVHRVYKCHCYTCTHWYICVCVLCIRWETWIKSYDT